MAEMVTLYHPELEETKEVPAGSVPVLAKSGWVTTDDTSEAVQEPDDPQEPEEQEGALDV